MFLQGKENVSQAADDRKEKKALPAALSPQNVFGSGRRTFFLPPLRAGLTVEAACILPLFLWAVLAALYLIEVSVVQVRLVGGIHEAGRKMALLSYGIYGGTSEEEKGTGVGEQLISMNYDLVKPEYTYGDSRIDFYMERNGEKFLTEVKGCTLADDLHPGTGLFPDAPTERGVKHLHELAKAAKEGYHCAIAFVIQMNGIYRVLPNEEKQPEFKEALVNAAKAGVQVAFYRCEVETDSIKIAGVS